MIFDFEIFPIQLMNNALETAESWCIVGLTAILCLLKRKNSTFL